jgi:hypothetical protein
MIPSFEFKSFNPKIDPNSASSSTSLRGKGRGNKPKKVRKRGGIPIADDFPEEEDFRLKYNSSVFKDVEDEGESYEESEGSERKSLAFEPIDLWFPEEVAVEEVIRKRRKIKEQIISDHLSRQASKDAKASKEGKVSKENKFTGVAEVTGATDVTARSTRSKAREAECRLKSSLYTSEMANRVKMTDRLLGRMLDYYDKEFFCGKFWDMVDETGMMFKLSAAGNEDAFFKQQKGKVAAYCSTKGCKCEIVMHSGVGKLAVRGNYVPPKGASPLKPPTNESKKPKARKPTAYQALCKGGEFGSRGFKGAATPPFCGEIEAAIQACTTKRQMEELVGEAEKDLYGTEEVCGLVCRDRLDCIQVLLEHELIHLFISGFQGKVKVNHGPPFKELARSLFGHTQYTHTIGHPVGLSRFIVLQDKERKYESWRTGDIVTYSGGYCCTGYPKGGASTPSPPTNELEKSKKKRKAKTELDDDSSNDETVDGGGDDDDEREGGKGEQAPPTFPLGIILVKGKEKLTLISPDGSIVEKVKYTNVDSPDRPITKEETKLMLQWVHQFTDNKKRTRIGSKVDRSTGQSGCSSGVVVGKKGLYAEVSFERGFSIPVPYHSLRLSTREKK